MCFAGSTHTYNLDAWIRNGCGEDYFLANLGPRHCNFWHKDCILVVQSWVILQFQSQVSEPVPILITIFGIKHYVMTKATEPLQYRTDGRVSTSRQNPEHLVQNQV